MNYAKLFSSIIHSTIWREPSHVRLVWVTLIAMADQYGTAYASVPGLADAARVSRSEVEDALYRLGLPDPDSRSQVEEGRRIKTVPGGWFLVNHGYYRDLMGQEDRRQKATERKRRQREREREGQDIESHALSPIVPNVPQVTTSDQNISSHLISGLSDPSGKDLPKDLKRSSNGDSTLAAQVREVFDFWRENTGHKTARLDQKRATRIKARLSEKFTPAELKQAIANRIHDPWLMGKDPKSTQVFDKLETLLRDASQVERLRDLGKTSDWDNMNWTEKRYESERRQKLNGQR